MWGEFGRVQLLFTPSFSVFFGSIANWLCQADNGFVIQQKWAPGAVRTGRRSVVKWDVNGLLWNEPVRTKEGTEHQPLHTLLKGQCSLSRVDRQFWTHFSSLFNSRWLRFHRKPSVSTEEPLNCC
jgi:hypothetical protein